MPGDMADYFMAIDGQQQQGPFPVHQLLARGMRPESLVWCEGMGAWQRADSVPELVGLLLPPPAPPQQQYAVPAAGYPQQQYAGVIQYPVAPPPGSYSSVPPYNPSDSKRVIAGVMGIVLGSLGVHKFVLGYSTAGVVMLLVSVLSCFTLAPVMGLIGLIEGIIYLTKSDEEFYRMYVAQERSWF
jgi:TM2 domain-containing membrane protein YozV